MKYKKSMIIVMLAIFLFSIASVCASEIDTPVDSDDTAQLELSVNEDGIEDNLQTSEENTKLAVEENDETLSSEIDSEILTADQFTYSELREQIGSGGNINLTKGTYTYNQNDGETIQITNYSVINGNGAVIDMAQSGHRAFDVPVSNVTFINLTIKNANYNDDGGAIFFAHSGTVTNCNFIGNHATLRGGAIYFSSLGATHEVRNCNFTNNTARYGGAVYFTRKGDVTNCNFTDNHAMHGGALQFSEKGTVTNCNFTGNDATAGSAIHFSTFITSATKTVSNSCFLNNRANSEDLEVTKNENNITIIFKGNDNLLNAIYANTDVTFTKVTYWGANGIANTGSSPKTPSRSNREAGQNITIGVVVNDKLVLSDVIVTDKGGMIVLPIIAGDNYYISVCHDADSYYTEAKKTITNNTKFNVNVTPQTTHNKTVNITANSNIPNDVVKGKLLFIVSDGANITASYAGNGTWWALHEFNDDGVYQVNASYTAFSNVEITNAIINISRLSLNLNASYTVSVLDDGFAVNIIVNSDPKINGNLSIKFNGEEYQVEMVNGTANFTSKKVYANTYNTAIFYASSDSYKNSTTTVKAIVKTTEVSKVNNFNFYYYNNDMGSDSEKGISIIKVVDCDGNPIKNGLVTITIMNKYKLKVRTDANGVAKFTKAYKPGTYSVTASHDNKVTKLGNLVLKSVVNLPKVSKVSKSAKTTTIKITLKGTGPIKEKTVVVNMNKKSYKVKTDKNGVALFKVTQQMVSKLAVGKTYTVRATYRMDSVAQGIQILK